MARGWESKNIESQQEAAGAARKMRPAISAEERERLERRQAVELALAVKRSELTHATTDAHRAYLRRVINDLTAILNS